MRISLPAGGEAPDSTQKLVLPSAEPPLRAPGASLSAGTAGQTQVSAPRGPVPSPKGWKLPLLLVGLGLAGAAAYFFFARGMGLPAATKAPAAVTPEAVPAGAQIYLDQAKAGDAHAMRMLGVMYYYGLNVPQDRGKGLYWYRQAAEKGSEAARQELEKLEGKP